MAHWVKYMLRKEENLELGSPASHKSRFWKHTFATLATRR